MHGKSMKKFKRLPLTALRTFEAAARLESFKDAAEELGVTATTVSNQIRMLEKDWGCQLFVRMTRQVVLTEIGQSLGRVVRQSFESIAQEVEFHIASKRQSVSLAVGSIIGARWLMPRLNSFRMDLPNIDLVLRRGRRITSPNDMPAAVVVDWGVGDWNGLDVEPLMKIRYSPVISPKLIKGRQGLKMPSDIARFAAIHQQDRSEWRAWLNAAGVGDLVFMDEMIIEDSNIAHQAVLMEQGIGLGILPFVQDEIDCGVLVKPFKQELVPEKSYYILTRPGARQRREVAAVCDWLRQQAHGYAKIYPFTFLTGTMPVL
jgi:LysR family glycine cleavage system transcriptional activator